MTGPTDREILAWLVWREGGGHGSPGEGGRMIACTAESRMAGRCLLVAFALARYGTEPVTFARIEATLAQVNAAVFGTPMQLKGRER